MNRNKTCNAVKPIACSSMILQWQTSRLNYQHVNHTKPDQHSGILKVHMHRNF